MDVIEIIQTKRNGGTLDKEQIDWFISNFSSGYIPDEQTAALAMSIYFNGMETDELTNWTKAMVASGVTLDLDSVGKFTVDKHSTGGVGDKVSLILVPLIASYGLAVPQLSGRGLGHGGGTLDKMESITGWNASLSEKQMLTQLREIGGIIAAANEDINPADRRLYALRDVTHTVDSIPLIASSIISKKIAEGTESLVLDVKTGSGAFMVDFNDARELAKTMVELGENSGMKTVALITSMETVLGKTAGNALEVSESLEVLEGGGPEDLIEVTLALAKEMLELAHVDADPSEMLASGKPREIFEKMVLAQGGDLSKGLPVAEFKKTIKASATGFLSKLDCRSVGIAAWRLGAGRARKEDPVSPTAGVVCLAKPGDHVKTGESVLELHGDKNDCFDYAIEALEGAIEISEVAPPASPLVLDKIFV
ncbi:MAG: thymidine phosphorylase [Actinomycetota bacterium]|nr:thymidine phosphorylase [Acidimicrobiales bacterium]MEC7899121.1 thymidine phosphorylase [Actinomycetota bacterium]|tara:strand:+ start:7032 stop:8303 length:1272 start_codon:yes stop_codon:yes gene_type:complete